MLVPDGQPVRWALRGLHGVRLAERVYGPTLMLKTCQRAAEEALPIFLFGGSGELLAALQQALQDRFPQLEIAGVLPSKFRRLTGPREKQELVETIKSSGAKIAFVGLGCPRQEVFAYEFQDALSMPLLAVGAAFNFHAGLLSQAPPLMQRWGLEWLFRLCAEPRRLWKRYLLLNPLYLTLLAAQWTRLKRFDDAENCPPNTEILYG
jgi:exopolysaccharide biosynthesis WecB/TagA/CpsF family protein